MMETLPSRIASALRSDTEFQGAAVRLLVGVVVSSLMAVGMLAGQFALSGRVYGAFFGYFFVLSFAFAAHILLRPGGLARPYLSVLFDITTTTIAVYLTGSVHSVMFPLYIWIIVTNGTRFGVGTMAAAAVAAIIMYNGQLLAQGLWSDHVLAAMTYSLFLTIFPLYFTKTIGALHQARRDAESASRSKSEFLANITHELRTPLVGVTSLSSLLATTPLNREQLGYVMTLQSSAELLTRLIDDLLDLARIEAGRFELRREPFEPSKAVRDIVEMMAPVAREKGIRLRHEVAPALEAVIGDELRFKQVLVNLVGNAVKFTHQGEVVVRAQALDSSQEERRRMRFEVEDTGIGIPPAQLPRVFERFRQGDGSAARVYQGAGLGTTISKHLVEIMGGTIGVASEIGKGTRFWFELELASAAGTAALSPIIPEAVHSGSILLVEDNAVNAMAIGTILRKAGYFVDVAEDGPAALKAQEDSRYGMVFLDMQLPGMDGPEVARLWRERESGAATPIVALTANASTEDREVCLAAGMNDFLSKPVNTARLLAVATLYCRRVESEAAS